MIRHTYDSEAKALYVQLDGPQERVGTLEVKGDIKFRRPGKVVPFEGTLLLDFTEEGQLAGVEVLGSRVPEGLAKPQPFSSAKVELNVGMTTLPDAVREANSIYNALMSAGIKPDVTFRFNGILYSANGNHCDRVEYT